MKVKPRKKGVGDRVLTGTVSKCIATSLSPFCLSLLFLSVSSNPNLVDSHDLPLHISSKIFFFSSDTREANFNYYFFFNFYKF